MVFFALLALLLIIWGGYLIFQKGLDILAVLVELVGLLGGAGSLILRQLQEDLNEKAESIEKVLGAPGAPRVRMNRDSSKWGRKSRQNICVRSRLHWR